MRSDLEHHSIESPDPETALSAAGQSASARPQNATASGAPSGSTGLVLASMWASAFVIAAIIISQAGRLGPLNPAYAEMASEGSDYSLMTTQGGNDENLYVLDNRAGKLFVYKHVPNEGLILHDAQDIAQLITRLQRPPGN